MTALPKVVASGNEGALDRVVEIERLAALEPIDYEATRADAAKRLGARTTVLDREVAKKRREFGLQDIQDDPGQGRAVKIADICRQAFIPLYDALKDVLSRIPKRSTTVLTNSRNRPWTRDGFGSSFNKAKIKSGLGQRNLHFHDLRGTAATRFYVAGLSERVIAEIMGWEEEHVARIIRRYVDRFAATRAIIRHLNERRT
jgi:hypothetical protein